MGWLADIDQKRAVHNHRDWPNFVVYNWKLLCQQIIEIYNFKAKKTFHPKGGPTLWKHVILMIKR